jgi:predicted DNA-binding transcriptional regulator AlpA
MTVPLKETPGLTPVYVDQNLVAASFGMSLQTLRKMSLVDPAFPKAVRISHKKCVFPWNEVKAYFDARQGNVEPIAPSLRVAAAEAKAAAACQ